MNEYFPSSRRGAQQPPPIRLHYTAKLCILLDKIHRAKFQRLWNRVSPLARPFQPGDLSFLIHPIISLTVSLSPVRANQQHKSALCKSPNLRIMCLVSLSTVVLALTENGGQTSHDSSRYNSSTSWRFCETSILEMYTPAAWDNFVSRPELNRPRT